MTNVRKAEEYINAHPRCVARDVAEFAGTTTDCSSPALTWLTGKGRVQRRREAIAERGIRVQWVYYPAAAELAVPEQPAPKQLALSLDDAITPEDLVKAVVVEPETAPRSACPRTQTTRNPTTCTQSRTCVLPHHDVRAAATEGGLFPAHEPRSSSQLP